MDETKDDPGKKMRTLLAGGKSSPLDRLPKKANGTSSIPPKEEKAAEPRTESKGDSLSKDSSPQAAPKPVSPSKDNKFNFGPAFWTIASIMSLTVNVIVLIILLAVLQNIRTLKLGSAMDIGNGLLGGLYTNFEKMDNAHITKTIPVNTTIPSS
jgi:hypothetical protein